MGALGLAVAVVCCLPTPASLKGRECGADEECGGRGLVCRGVCVEEAAGPGGEDAEAGVPASPDAGRPDGAVDSGLDGGVDAGAVRCDAGALPPEAQCFDGQDNDCDGLVDCVDPSCQQKACKAGSPAFVCCSPDGGAGTCRDLSADPLNCGSCGTACAQGEDCRPAVSGAIRSGQCSCDGDTDCQTALGTTNDQSCERQLCSCNEVTECSPGQLCSGEGNDAGFCYVAPAP